MYKKYPWELQHPDIIYNQFIDILSKYEIWSFEKMNQIHLMSCITELLEEIYNLDKNDFLRTFDYKNGHDISLSHIGQNFKNGKFTNEMINVSVQNFYVSIIYREIELDVIRFNYKHYGALFLYLVDNLKKFKRHANRNIYLTAKSIINATYYFINSRYKRFVYCDATNNFIKKEIYDMLHAYGQTAVIWHIDEFWFLDNQQDQLNALVQRFQQSSFEFTVQNVKLKDFKSSQEYQRFINFT